MSRSVATTSSSDLLRGLWLACHRVPSIAVTAMTTALAIAAGNTWDTCALVAAAVLTGQLSIGWSNDAIDASRDVVVRRPDKPIAEGLATAHQVGVAALIALTLTVPLSLALGWRAGLVHLTGVTCGWLYNLGLKSTLASPVPYAVAFATLPAVATFARDDPQRPVWWAVVAASLIGVAAHFGNVIPDLADDAQTGVRGLPQRLGRTGSAVAASASAIAAVATVTFGPSGRPSPLAWGVLGASAVAAVGAAVVVRRRARSEISFYATMAVAAMGVVLICVGGLT